MSDYIPLILTTPAENAVIHLLRKDWAELTCVRANGISNFSNFEENRNENDIATPESVGFQWTGGTPPFRFVLKDEEGRIVRQADDLADRIYITTNLNTSANYFWSVTDRKNNTVSSSFFTAYSPRFIAIPDRSAGPRNLRDFGGRRTNDGKMTRQGVAYRGADCDSFPAGSGENKRFLKEELKIRTELDLRYTGEIKGQTISKLGPDVRFIHRPINAYHPFTEEQNILFRDTLRLFADPEIYPVFYHCAGGVDRTGELSFLLNMLLGVDLEEALLDYEASSLSIFQRPRTIAYFQRWLSVLAQTGEPQDNWQQHVEKYMLSIGLTPEELTSIRKNLTVSLQEHQTEIR